MATTNCEHTHQGPCGALETSNVKVTTSTAKNQEEESVGVEGGQRDAEDNVGEQDGHALATRIDAMKRMERSNKEAARATEDGTKQKEKGHRRDHVKRMGQLVKDAAETAKNISFEDLDGQKFGLFKMAIQLASEYVELAEAEREETRKQAEKQPIGGPPPTLQQSWAQKAASNATRPLTYERPHLAIPPSRTTAGNANEKRVMIRIRSEEERKKIEHATPAQLKDMFQSNGAPAGSIVAARRSQNGGVILHMASREAKRAMEEDAEAIQRGCPSAHVLKPSFVVAVDSVRIDAFDDKDQGACIEKLKRENSTLHPGLEVVRVEWPPFAWAKKAGGEIKKYSTLLVETKSPEEANRLIAEGIVENSQLLCCRKWETASRPKQCYRCQQYGHLQGSCQRPAKCGHCAEAHPTKDHQGQGQRHCVVCQGNHEAWSSDCRVRQREVERLKQRRENAPKWYKEPSATDQPIPAPAQTEDGWKTASPKRKRLEEISGNQQPRKVGRPPKILEREPGQTHLTQFRGRTGFQDAVNAINATLTPSITNTNLNGSDFNIHIDE